MKKLQLPSGMTRAFHRVGLKLKKHSPEILVITGVTGTVVSAVMACKATTKLESILNEHNMKLETFQGALDNPELLPEGETYTEEDHKQDVKTAYIQTGYELAKLYAPAVGVGVLSITAILAGHNITRKRNVALAAAYTTVDKAFKEYRGRVVDRFGEALDKELRYNIKTKEVEEIVTNEDGTETIVKTQTTVSGLEQYSDYAKFFCEGCRGWSKDPDYNLMFLKDTQRYMNDRLKARGHVFLNEVYDALGIDRTKAGNVVGWIYDEKDPNGDNYIEFGIYNLNSEAAHRFVNGWERNILLDFNVDGPILELI